MKIKKYYPDNEIFNSISCKESCAVAQQLQTFYGVNSHHQNGAAKWSIGRIKTLARSMILRAIIKCPDAANFYFWPFVISHVVEILNNTQKYFGLTPMEIFTGIKAQ